MANNELTYKGYTGSIQASVEDGCLHGRIQFIDDIVTYEGETVPEISAAFQGAVDRYIAHCKETGKQPNKPYSGSLNIRIGQERHRSLAQRAFRQKTSINDLVCQAVDGLLNKETDVAERRTHPSVITVPVDPDPQLADIAVFESIGGRSCLKVISGGMPEKVH